MRRVLICEPDPGLCSDLVRVVRAAGYTAEAAGCSAAAARVDAGGIDAVVIDVSGPDGLRHLEELTRCGRGVPVLATGVQASVELAVEAMKRGARDFLRKPFPVCALESTLNGVLETGGLRARGAGDATLLTDDPAMERVLRKADAAAVTDATVQISGESGTGKELLARYIHWKSPRRTGPFVAVNCAALSEDLGESELFGHERGAFTGAVESRPGQVTAADGGTLLLDEVGGASPVLQPKLLRVLQEREVLPVGSVTPRRIDVRIVSTTQRDLQQAVASGRFREDLYYRLDVIALHVPPLRDRPADIRLLARSFLRRFAEVSGTEPPELTDRALSRLLRHPFRGNVRELENLMRRAVVLYPGGEVDVDRLLARTESLPPGPGILSGSLNLRLLERRAIARSLAETQGNRTEASRVLGISVRTLRNKIRLYGLR